MCNNQNSQNKNRFKLMNYRISKNGLLRLFARKNQNNQRKNSKNWRENKKNFPCWYRHQLFQILQQQVAKAQSQENTELLKKAEKAQKCLQIQSGQIDEIKQEIDKKIECLFQTSLGRAFVLQARRMQFETQQNIQTQLSIMFIQKKEELENQIKQEEKQGGEDIQNLEAFDQVHFIANLIKQIEMKQQVKYNSQLEKLQSLYLWVEEKGNDYQIDQKQVEIQEDELKREEEIKEETQNLESLNRKFNENKAQLDASQDILQQELKKVRIIQKELNQLVSEQKEKENQEKSLIQVKNSLLAQNKNITQSFQKLRPKKEAYSMYWIVLALIIVLELNPFFGIF